MTPSSEPTQLQLVGQMARHLRVPNATGFGLLGSSPFDHEWATFGEPASGHYFEEIGCLAFDRPQPATSQTRQ